MNYTARKFQKPAPPPVNVRQKEKLRFFFTSEQSQLVYIHAPAGYGKTAQTLMALKKMGGVSAWFSADAYDSVLKNFCIGIMFSLASSMKKNKFISDFVNTSSFAVSPVGTMADLLISLSYENIPDAIVIDNFQLCQNSETAKTVLMMQNMLPPKKLLIVVSRAVPPAEFSELILKKKIHTIGTEDLRFTENETENLFAFHNIALTKDVLSEIIRQTDGCIMYILAILYIYTDKRQDKYFMENTVDSYLKTECFDVFDEPAKIFLMKSSVCEIVSIDYCREVLKFVNCENVLNYIANTTGFVNKINPSEYKYHDIIRKCFKRQLSRCTEISLEDLYTRSAYWFCENGSPFTALTLAFESDKISLINDVILRIAGHYETIGIIDYAGCVTSYLSRARNSTLNEIAVNFPSICIRCAWVCFLEGRPDEMHYWIEIIEKFLMNYENFSNGNEVIAAILICSVNPSLNAKEMISFFKSMGGHFSEYKNLQFPPPRQSFCDSLTGNLPFFHKAQRDYGDAAGCPEEFLACSEKNLSLFFGAYYKSLHNLLAAGIYYERNELEKALSFAQNSIDNFTERNIEITFAANMILTEILFAKNLKDEAHSLLRETKVIIEKRNAAYLEKNLRAYEIREMLYDGNKSAAREWLADSNAYINTPLKLYQCFQNMTTAKALTVSEDFNGAVRFLNKIIEFNGKYGRLTDMIEALSLMSICCWKKKRYEDAVSNITEALLLSQKSSVIMPIILLGTDIAVILRKILNKTCLPHSETGKLDKAFVNHILLLSLERGRTYRGMFSLSDKMSNIRLSPKQTLVLQLLAQNRTYCEIGEIGKIKITTVREHIGRIYQKLEVSNSGDALLKARELGLIDKE